MKLSPACAALALGVALVACSDATPPGPPPEPGEPLAGLSEAERGRFLLGRALFERIATQDEGLGPLYNADRCSSCHDAPAVGGGGLAFPVLKATRWVDDRCDALAAVGGDNIQLRATDLLVAHGLGAEGIPPEATDSVYVIAPPLFGLGLLETVPESELARRADPDDADGDGISGRLPRRPDGASARFGRKGDAATVQGFIDTALRFELGLTTPEHPLEEARNGVVIPESADPVPEPEMDARGLGLLTDYVRFLAPPSPEQGLSPAAADSVARGEEVFRDIGCADCHTPELRTGEADEDALSERMLRPWSDLLLHDLGGGPADVCGPDAAPGEYRTAPLWGLRHRSRYMHDGVILDLEEAITAHGAEGRAATDAFEALMPRDRASLVRFLDSL